MENVKECLDKLELYLLELDYKYIDIHKDLFEDPEEYKLDVRSYCVLSHAAFEEFVENICLYTLNEIEYNFKYTQRISYSTLCLLHFNGNAKTIDDDSWKDENKMFDYFLGKLEYIKSDFSKYIMNNNHGVKLKYLKKMLIPLGLYVTLDIKHQTALSNLAQYRGLYAHTSHRNKKILTPEDARKQVADVYNIMLDLLKRSKAI